MSFLSHTRHSRRSSSIASSSVPTPSHQLGGTRTFHVPRISSINCITEEDSLNLAGEQESAGTAVVEAGQPKPSADQGLFMTDADLTDDLEMERRQTVISSYETVQVVATLLLGTGLSLWFETSLKPPVGQTATAPEVTCPAEAGARAPPMPPAWEALVGSWLTTLVDESTSLLLVLFTALNLFGLLTLSPQLFYMRQALSKDKVLFDPFCEQLKVLRQDAIFSILYSMPLLVLILGLMALRGQGLAPRAGGVLLLVLAISGTRIITLTRATFRGLRMPNAKNKPKPPDDGNDRGLHALWLDVFRRVLLVPTPGTRNAVDAPRFLRSVCGGGGHGGVGGAAASAFGHRRCRDGGGSRGAGRRAAAAAPAVAATPEAPSNRHHQPIQLVRQHPERRPSRHHRSWLRRRPRTVPRWCRPHRASTAAWAAPQTPSHPPSVSRARHRLPFHCHPRMTS